MTLNHLVAGTRKAAKTKLSNNGKMEAVERESEYLLIMKLKSFCGEIDSPVTYCKGSNDSPSLSLLISDWLFSGHAHVPASVVLSRRTGLSDQVAAVTWSLH